MPLTDVPTTLLRQMNTTFHAMSKDHEDFPDYEEMTADAREEAAALQDVLEQIQAQEKELACLRTVRDQIFPRAQQAYANLSSKVAARAQGNETVIMGAAFHVTRDRRNLGVQPLPQPENVQIIASSDVGTLT